MGKPALSTRRPAGQSSRAASAPPSHRDDPDAVSLHTTNDEYEHDDPELPAYSDVENADSRPPPSAPDFANAARAPPPTLNDQYPVIYPSNTTLNDAQWHVQTPRSSKSGVGRETSMRMDERLMQPDELHNYIIKYLQRVPVKPILHIHGSHFETQQKDKNKTERESVVDFNIMFDLRQYMIAEPRDPWWDACVVSDDQEAYRGSFRKTVRQISKDTPDTTVNAVENGGLHQNLSLEDHCFDFCSSKSPLRAFRVARHFSGLDMNLLRMEIARIIRATNYRGIIDIGLTVLDRNVDIYSPHWANRLRISWVRWLFYLSFLWIFTWPFLFFMTKWWCVYDVYWRFSAELNTASARHHGGCCNVPVPDQENIVVSYPYASEQRWIETNALLIQNLALERFHGDATDLPTRANARSGNSRSVSIQPTGNRNVDAAVGFMNSNVNVWNALSRGGAPQNDAWGENS